MDEDRNHGSSIVKSPNETLHIASKLDSLHIFSATAGFRLWIWKASIQNALQQLASDTKTSKARQASSSLENSHSLGSGSGSGSGSENSSSNSLAVGQELPDSGCFVMPPFSPYAAKVPWHTGSRALFSQVFPKYGNYCGPNWSSGRQSGSLVWDVAPVDWLDYCCFKHDVGYDSHSQEELYRADLALLECLRKMPRERLGPKNPSGFVREFHRSVYILGLERFLIPYRRTILRQQRRIK